MAQSMVEGLRAAHLLDVDTQKPRVIEELNQAILHELQAEDRLHAEVKQLMQAYEVEIEKGNVDYQKMFNLIKKKLIQDRGIIL